MLLLTVLPICAYAKGNITVHVVNGGTDVRFAPAINYIKHVLLPTLEKMGLNSALAVKKYGYYPKGMGETVLEVNACAGLKPISLANFIEVKQIEGVSVCTFLEKQQVAQRQANEAAKILRKKGYETNIKTVNDESNPLQKGSSIALWTKPNDGMVLGADGIGELRKSSEMVGKEAAENLCNELEARATVDVHLADMLVPYIALADGHSVYYTRKVTDHLETNIRLVEHILGTKISVTQKDGIYCVEKIEKRL
jgi:RNA 3'-terminal phosphate cyclase (ATP)